MFVLLLGDKASPSIGNTLWRVSTMFTRLVITPPEENGFGWNLGYSEYILWSWPWQTLDTIRAETGAGEWAEFFCPANNARLCRFPVSQISRNLHTRRGSERWWILSENICENLPVRGLFSKKVNFCVNVVNDFGLQAAISAKWLQILESHDWLALLYGMLAFHLYRWNHLKVIHLACRLRTRNDIPGHRRLFRLRCRRNVAKSFAWRRQQANVDVALLLTL